MFWRYVLSKSNIFRNDDNEVENIVANPYPLLFKLPYFKPILLALKFLNFEKYGFVYKVEKDNGNVEFLSKNTSLSFNQ